MNADDDILTKEQKIELVMEQFDLLYHHARQETGWLDIPKPVNDAMDEAYRLLGQFISDSKANPTKTPVSRQRRAG